jgi:hypothetical protein
MTYKVGTHNGTPVRVTYRHDPGSLPSISWSGGKSGSAQGSSLGPANHNCYPSRDDLLYWQSVIDLPRDEAQVDRSMTAHERVRRAETAAYHEAYIQDAQSQC